MPFAGIALGLNVFVWDRAVGLAPYNYDLQRQVELVSLALLASFALWRPASIRGPWSLLPRPARFGMLTVLVLGAASSTAAAYPKVAFREVGLFVMLGVSVMLVAQARRTHGRTFDRIVTLVLFAGATVYVVAFLTMDGLFALRLVGTREHQMWGFDNPRFFGQVGYWTFPVLVTMFLDSSAPARIRRVVGAVAVLWGVLIIESGTRAAVYAILVSMTVVWSVRMPGARRWVRAALLLLAGSLGSWLLIYGSVGGRSGLFRIAAAGADDSGRFPLWADAIELTGRRPLLGVGPEHYAHTAGTAFGSPHNVPLQLFAEWGVPAALIALALAAWGTWTWLRPRKAVRDARNAVVAVETNVGLAAALISGGFASLVEGSINPPVGQLFVAATVGWILGIHFSTTAMPSSTPRQKLLAVTTVVIAMSVVIYGALPYALDPAAHSRQFTVENPGEEFSPRFWIVGRLVP